MAEPDYQLEAVKIAGEWNKQLSLWATGAVVLSISFMKDLLQGVSISTAWRTELAFSWILFIVSFIAGLIAYGAPITGAGKDEFKLSVNTFTRIFSILQGVFFAVGTFLLVLFAFFNMSTRFANDSHPKSDSAIPVAHFVISKSAYVATSHQKRHNHTFLLNQTTGEIWEM